MSSATIVTLRHGETYYSRFWATRPEPFLWKSVRATAYSSGPKAAKLKAAIFDLLRLHRAFYPVSDKYTGMTPDGKSDVNELLDAVKSAGILPDEIISSDYRRAKQTARLAAALSPKRIDVRIEPAFRERSYGNLYGWSSKYYPMLYPRFNFRDIESDISLVPPGGESIRDVFGRVGGPFASLVQACPGSTVFVAAHTKVMICMHGILTCISLDEANSQLKRMHKASAFMYIRQPDGKWTPDYSFSRMRRPG